MRRKPLRFKFGKIKGTREPIKSPSIGTIVVFTNMGKYTIPSNKFQEFDEEMQVTEGEEGRYFFIRFVADYLGRQFDWREAQSFFGDDRNEH